MSTWTHVNASIRVDDIRMDREGHTIDLGKMALWGDSEEKWDECDIPMGSEGSLEYKVTSDPDKSSLAAHVVTIWGDLRSYNDVEEIFRYLTRVIKGQIIRSGIAEIDVNHDHKYLYQVEYLGEGSKYRWKLISKTKCRFS